jgi:hypothetical protein
LSNEQQRWEHKSKNKSYQASHSVLMFHVPIVALMPIFYILDDNG